MPPRSSPVVLACSIATQPLAVSDVIWNCDPMNGSSAVPLQSSSVALQSSVPGRT